MGLKDDSAIDKNALDFEWERQPSLLEKYSSRYGDALFNRDSIKDQMELFAADKSLEVRANPEEFGLEKATDKAVEAIVTKSEEYQKLQRKLRKENKNVNAYFSAQKVLEHKKTALEFLSRHYFTGYWSDPKIPKDAKDAYAQETSNRHTEALSKNKRIGGKRGKKEKE